MEVQVDYYKLVIEKKMSDGKTIPQDQGLILINKDDDSLMFFETYDNDCKNLFWASEKDVEFVQTLQENWSEEKINERNRYINGEFL